MTPDPWCTAGVHGTRRAYNTGCRCTTARAAHSADKKARRRTPAMIDATGTRRRIQALLRAGWPGHVIAARLFCTQTNVERMRNQDRIHVRNARAVAALYDEIGLAEGGNTKSARRAERMGWPSPVEWGDDIDDPKAKPIDLDRRVPGGGWGGALIEDIEVLALNGETWDRAAYRLGTSQKTLERRLQRTRRDLYARFTRNSEMYHAHEPNRNQWSA